MSDFYAGEEHNDERLLNTLCGQKCGGCRPEFMFGSDGFESHSSLSVQIYNALYGGDTDSLELAD